MWPYMRGALNMVTDLFEQPNLLKPAGGREQFRERALCFFGDVENAVAAIAVT